MTRIRVATLFAAITLQAQDRPASATSPDGPDPGFGTVSIIAFDPATREFGVGVQSRAFGAGAASALCRARRGRGGHAGVSQPALRSQRRRAAATA